jgi:hypothetical protein
MLESDQQSIAMAGYQTKVLLKPMPLEARTKTKAPKPRTGFGPLF